MKPISMSAHLMTPHDFSRLDTYFLGNACLGYIFATPKIVALSPVVGLERATVKGIARSASAYFGLCARVGSRSAPMGPPPKSEAVN